MANPEWTEPSDWDDADPLADALREIDELLLQSESDPAVMVEMLTDIVRIASAALDTQVSA